MLVLGVGWGFRVGMVVIGLLEGGWVFLGLGFKGLKFFFEIFFFFGGGGGGENVVWSVFGV